ncbi:lipase member N-like isoform X2 [Thrips palmi]|uniref:Lipase member N-like isoform X2 n=1 Tax=Thrips palmi TaxID=161013 RepID=A0A6P8ZT04_THRPL|nr:lipase member N-like isoform X2 [Thrips palmi]
MTMGAGGCTMVASPYRIIGGGRVVSALQLVDNGFDVWLGNYRGTPYGLRHKTLSPKSHEFWDFSWHENGVLDQAAMIDYILNITGRERLFAVSYSMSCTASMVLYSERPEYNSKVIANIFFAPSAFIKHPTGLWQLTKVTMKMFPGLTNLLKDATGNHIINDKLPFSDVSLTTICHVAKRNIILAPICTLLSEFFAGRHSPSAADRLLRGLTVRIPSGASIRQCVHYAQSIERGGEFRQYDFGRARNLELYGSSEPPSYNLQAVASPVHFFCGISDRTVSIKDCDTLTKTIPSTVSVNKVPRYQHHDFILGEGLDELVNTKVIAYLLSYL